ncbi:MAG: DUF5615 family PIN-like protein [Bacteroidia bacterium]|nr:DUF5615 family PIN-like protein [Bacteroidia bacterium]
MDYFFPKEQGYDIVHIGAVAPSITDEAVMQLAIQEQRIIITFDRDYGHLVFGEGYRPPGVIYLRIQDYDPDYPGIFLHSLIESENLSFEGQFTVVSENSIRQRRIE